jgi:hypothetical protein
VSTPRPQPARRRVSLRDALSFAAFVSLWLIPITWVGITYSPVPFFGRRLNAQYGVGCLFIKEARAWETHHVQVRPAGTDVWIEPEADELSTMRPFGYWTRFDMLVARSVPDHRGLFTRQKLAEFVRDRWAERHPDAPPADAVRFVLAYELTSQYTYPAGAWTPRRLDSYPETRRDVLSTHTFDGRLPTDELQGVAPRAARPFGSCGR